MTSDEVGCCLAFTLLVMHLLWLQGATCSQTLPTLLFTALCLMMLRPSPVSALQMPLPMSTAMHGLVC